MTYNFRILENLYLIESTHPAIKKAKFEISVRKPKKKSAVKHSVEKPILIVNYFCKNALLFIFDKIPNKIFNIQTKIFF